MLCFGNYWASSIHMESCSQTALKCTVGAKGIWNHLTQMCLLFSLVWKGLSLDVAMSLCLPSFFLILCLLTLRRWFWGVFSVILFSKLLTLIITHTAIKYNHILSLVTQQHFSYIHIAPLSILSYKVRYGGNRAFYPFSNMAAIALNVLCLHCSGRQKLAPSSVWAFDSCSCSKLRFSISIKCTADFREFHC